MIPRKVIQFFLTLRYLANRLHRNQNALRLFYCLFFWRSESHSDLCNLLSCSFEGTFNFCFQIKGPSNSYRTWNLGDEVHKHRRSSVAYTKSSDGEQRRQRNDSAPFTFTGVFFIRGSKTSARDCRVRVDTPTSVKSPHASARSPKPCRKITIETTSPNGRITSSFSIYATGNSPPIGSNAGKIQVPKVAKKATKME